MVLQKPFIIIKQFIINLLLYFLPRPESAPEGNEVVTENGVRKIVKKLFLYLVIGMWISNILATLRHAGILQSHAISISSTDLLDSVFNLSVPEALLFCLTLIYYSIMPFLRYMYKWLPATGAIYAISTGFILSCGMGIVKMHMIAVILLSIACAAVSSLLPLYLLKYRHLQLPKYLACITYVSFVSVSLGGSVLNTLYQISYFRTLAGYLLKISHNVGIIIAFDGIKVVIAFLFMFLAYNRINDYSSRGVSKQYEWLVAFTGFYTVMLIVVKIFEMLVFIFT